MHVLRSPEFGKVGLWLQERDMSVYKLSQKNKTTDKTRARQNPTITRKYLGFRNPKTGSPQKIAPSFYKLSSITLICRILTTV